MRVLEIVEALGGEVLGDALWSAERIASLEQATTSCISFVAQARFLPRLADSAAGGLILKREWTPSAGARSAMILTPDPYLYYARLTRWWVAKHACAPAVGVHATACIGSGVQIHPTVSVGPYAIIEDGAVLGPGVVVGARAHIGADARIGAGTRLASGVSFGEACRIGERGVIHPGAVIGSDGFGFAPSEGRWERIAQLGTVQMGNDVEIGANTCIDRGALDDTELDDGVKLDNLIQIAHNVRIGAHTAMAGCVGVAGSAIIGAGCTFGGAAMILGHLRIADGVHISAASVVMSSILKPGHYSGVFPIDDNGTWEKNAATLRQLHTLRSRVRALEKVNTAT